jgi:hypothetical protein
MINFTFEKPNKDAVEGKIRVEVHNYFNFYDETQFPLHFLIKNLSGKVIWQTDLYPNWYSEYNEISYTRSEIIDSLGNKLLEWEWSPFVHGDMNHQIFNIWALKNRGSNGIAIGSHDGMTGEWVGPLNNGLIKGTLIEASSLQYNELFRYYSNKSWIKCEKLLVSDHGQNLTFYEGGYSFTNSVKQDIKKKHVSADIITSTEMNTISINNVIEKCSQEGVVKWIHLDLEGYDGDIVYAIDKKFLPDILVFESCHMEKDYLQNLTEYLINKNYEVTTTFWNTTCIKK